MSAISTILARLRAAIWAIDVRDDIANAIEQCYSDVSNPTLKTEALEAALQNKIDEGEMAALTIGDGTITGAKLANGTIPKAKLDPSITFDADPALDTTSTNAIQNKVVAGAISTLQADLGVQTGIFGKTTGYYINLTADPVDISNLSTSSTGLAYSIIDCLEGDKFVINAVGATSGRAWGFLDSSNHVLSMADANATVTDLELTAPTNAVKLIINDKSEGMSYKVGNNLASKVGSLEKIEAGIPDDVKTVLLECFAHVYWDDNLGETHYTNLENALYGVPTEIWSWSTEYTGDGRLLKGYSLSDVTRNQQRLGFMYVLNNKRFGVYTGKGKQCAIDSNDSPAPDIFPIPIPSTATKVTINVTPSTDYIFGYIGKYEKNSGVDGYDYTMINESASWTHQGTYECTFEAQENLFLGYNGKKADNSDYTAAERNNRVVTVTFE